MKYLIIVLFLTSCGGMTQDEFEDADTQRDSTPEASVDAEVTDSSTDAGRDMETYPDTTIDGDGDSDADGDGDGDGDADFEEEEDASWDAEPEADVDLEPACGGSDLDTDPDNCGSCGRVCEGRLANCIDGECHGYTDCTIGSSSGACSLACGAVGAVCSSSCQSVLALRGPSLIWYFSSEGVETGWDSCHDIMHHPAARNHISCDTGWTSTPGRELVSTCCCRWLR